MSRTPLLAAGAAVVATAMFAALMPAASSFAATPAAWSTDAPFIDTVDGTQVRGDEIGTLDRTPRVTVKTAVAQHLGSTLVVRDVDTKAQLCVGDFPVRPAGRDYWYSTCSLTALPVGTSTVEAVFLQADEAETARAASPEIAPEASSTVSSAAETQPSSALRIHEIPQRVTLDVVGYDADSDTVSLRGTGFPGADIEVGQGLEGHRFAGIHKSVAVSEAGTWETTFTGPADEAFDSLQVKGFALQARADFTKGAPAKPSVVANEHASDIVLDVRASQGGRIVVRDRSGKDLASSDRTSASTILTLRAPTAETELFVHAVTSTVGGGDVLSPAEVVVVKAGIGPRIIGVPVVTDVARIGARAVASATAEPGALVIVRAADGTAVATRIAPAGGTVQLTIPLPASSRADVEYSVEQSKNGQTSDHDDFVVQGS